jgi:hypothetical protein
VLQREIRQIGFGVILFHDTTRDDLLKIKDHMSAFCDWMAEHQGRTEWRIAVFHELPLPGSPNYERLGRHLEFNIDEHPELWALPVNPLNGTELTCFELFEAKRDLMDMFDPGLLAAWDQSGKYQLTARPGTCVVGANQ